MKPKRPSIAVVGAGLGGLATAAGLSEQGLDVEVFEQASKIGEVGAGINISPQATKALLGLGGRLSRRLSEVGTVVTGQTFRSLTTGEQLAETVLVDDAATSGRFSAPYYVFQRADLLGVLADAALGIDAIHLGHRLNGLVESADGVELRFENGSRRYFDIVIGADGIRSRVRQTLYGPDEGTFANQVVWRALLDGTEFPDDVLGPHHFTGWMGAGRHLMVYHLRGTRVINITAQTDSDEWREEGWTSPGDADELRDVFSDAEPRLRTLLDAVTECTKWGLFTRRPSFDWGRGRVQLIGDAAHPMLPNAGQGAGQAFEDAYALVNWLTTRPDDPQAALAGFRDVRIPRAHAVQRQSRLNNRVAHAGDWETRKETFEERAQEGDTNMGLGWIYDYEPTLEWSVRREYPLSAASDIDD